MKHRDERFPDAELNQLLARGRLSGSEYDRIEESVLARVRPERKRRSWLFLAPAAAAASLLGVWLFGQSARDPGTFTPKGGDSARVALDVGCEGPEPHVCRLGQTLMFTVGAGDRRGYLAAYAERVGAPPSERIWYFPVPSGTQPRIEPISKTRVLGEGIRLGPPHVPGRYRVHVWISETPVERAEASSVPHAELNLEIVE